MGVKVEDSSMNYRVIASFEINGVVEKSDIIGAIFGQTDGLLPKELDLRELQNQGKIGRIEVIYETEGGRTKGNIIIPTGLNKVNTAIIAATIETVDRVGPCLANVELKKIENIKDLKRREIIERAAQIVKTWEATEEAPASLTPLVEEHKEKAKKSKNKIEVIGGDAKLPIGPQFHQSNKVIIVEGQADIKKLKSVGIGNTVAILGTGITQNLAEILKDKKEKIAFLDGDRGGDLILKELLYIARPDYVARAPKGKEVEDLNKDEILKALNNKVPLEKAVFLTGEHEGKTVAELESELKNKDKKKTSKTSSVTKKRSTKGPPRTGKQRSKSKKATTKGRTHETRSFRSSRSKALSGKQQGYEKSTTPARSLLSKSFKKQLVPIIRKIRGTKTGVFLDKELRPVKEVQTKSLYETLQVFNNGANTLVYDGVLTQRVLNQAADKGITTVVAATSADIDEVPKNVTYEFFSRVMR